MALENGGYVSTAFLGLSAVAFILYLINRRPKGLPPFPTTPLPVVGNLLSMSKDQRKLFSKWRRQHGDVFSLYMGSKLVVVLNGDAIQEALVKNADVFSERPELFVFEHALNGRGIIATSGPVWKSLRTLTLTLLRDFGFGKRSMEGQIVEEVHNFLQHIESKKGEKGNFAKLYNITTSNVLCSMMFGHRFDFEDKHFLECCQALAEFVEANSNVGYFNFFPFLKHVPIVGNTEFIIEKRNFFEDNLIKPEIENHYEKYDGSTDDFIYAYIKELKERESRGEDTSVLKENFTQVITDLYIAGTETTATTINWLVLFLLHNPEVQERCFQEIQNNVGLDRLPNLQDKAALPYFQATISETQRRASIVPLGVLHSTTLDTTFRGYQIPKGTVILPNLDSVLLDPERWTNPEEFRPERFLDDKGDFSIPTDFIPFSSGRRVCLGKALANLELFLFVAGLIQRFELRLPDNEPLPSLEPVFGATALPRPYNVRAIPR